jgi:hypothetical protein
VEEMELNSIIGMYYQLLLHMLSTLSKWILVSHRKDPVSTFKHTFTVRKKFNAAYGRLRCSEIDYVARHSLG